jgi:dephospho-CoA kinase
LIERGLHKQCNSLWVVTSRPGLQLDRLMRTRGLSEADARLRIVAQPPQSEKAALADVLIENNGALDELRAQVKHHWEQIQ